MKEKSLKVEIADTPYKQQQGLMFRKSLEEDSGMLFKFGKPDVLRFWGMNTFIPLDIAFVTPENKIAKIDRIKPFSLKTVSSEDKCVYAIEASEGFFKNNEITEGDEILIDNDTIKFLKVSGDKFGKIKEK